MYVRGHPLCLGFALRAWGLRGPGPEGRASDVRSAPLADAPGPWLPRLQQLIPRGTALRAKPRLPPPLLGSQSSAAQHLISVPFPLSSPGQQPHSRAQLKVCAQRALGRAFLAPSSVATPSVAPVSSFLLRVVSLWNSQPHHGAGSPQP